MFLNVRRVVLLFLYVNSSYNFVLCFRRLVHLRICVCVSCMFYFNLTFCCVRDPCFFMYYPLPSIPRTRYTFYFVCFRMFICVRVLCVLRARNCLYVSVSAL